MDKLEIIREAGNKYTIKIYVNGLVNYTASGQTKEEVLTEAESYTFLNSYSL